MTTISTIAIIGKEEHLKTLHDELKANLPSHRKYFIKKVHGFMGVPQND